MNGVHICNKTTPIETFDKNHWCFAWQNDNHYGIRNHVKYYLAGDIDRHTYYAVTNLTDEQIVYLTLQGSYIEKIIDTNLIDNDLLEYLCNNKSRWAIG